ncbi:MAG: hypothetical protein KDN20_18060 [Verrucomicrobiae bacterium]|nr:hypothetical protein [Verrucomicrobiae bacterium]
MKLLSKQEAVLLFTGEGWFGGVASKTELKIGDGQPIRPFAPSCSEDFQSLRPFIKENAWWALGEWQNHSLLENTTDVRFIGQLKEEFSLDKLAGNLRPALEVLAHLGVVQHYGAEAWIDHEAAVTELGLTCAQDFGWRFDGANEADPLSILATELERLRSDSGYVVASELREALHHRGIPNPDKRIGEWIRDGLVRLEGQNFGQARHGRGLFDDPEKQLIRLTLTGQHLTHS